MGSYTDNLFKRNRKKAAIDRKANSRHFDEPIFPKITSRSVDDHLDRESVETERNSNTQERLVSVAIKRGEDIHKGFKSHAELRRSLGDENPYENTPGDLCGFWTSHDRFLSRHQANRVGAEAGQCQLMGREFLSSDVDKW